MIKTKRIVNIISWVIISVLSVFLLINYNQIDSMVAIHSDLAGNLTFASKSMLIILLVIGAGVNLLFTLGYDISFIKELRKINNSSKLINIVSIMLQLIATTIVFFFIVRALI